MPPINQPVALARTYIIGCAALALLLVTVSLGAYLGSQTRAQFREIEASWTDYAGDVGKKGVWISSLRGYLGYGGIIHNFKNYVLRREPAYFDRAQGQINQFNAVMAQYLEGSPDPSERALLTTIKQTIDRYAKNLLVAREDAAKGLDVRQVDKIVAIDDTAAIRALSELETTWQVSRTASTSRIFSAVSQGQTLIWIGFASIGALVLAASILGYLLIILLRDLRSAVARLSDELVVRGELERSESRLARAVEQSPATIFITDTNARILYANRRFAELTGWSSDEVEGKTPNFLQSGDTSTQVYKEIKERLGRGEEWHGVFRNRKKDGGTYWAESSILPLVGPDGTIQNYIGIGEDITEKRQAREQVARAQKLEAVGLLAGGIAHDFNNILTTIVGAAHLAELDAPKGSDIAAEIEQIDIAARRAQSLVRGLLTFARREPGKPRPNDLCAIVREVSRLLRASMPPTITLNCPGDEEQVMVMADHTHLHQIVMNLCRNAAEAIGGADGTIDVSIISLGTEGPDGLAPRADGWVQLEIRDNGPGMSTETLNHLFDPFFTTKPLGKGSGLGLAVVAGLIEEVGGAIAVDSELGKGSRFEVTLPGTAQKQDEVATARADSPRGRERLILVDDEPEIAATFRRLLTRLGYQVEAYTSPVTALEKMLTDPMRYDLLITDMVMPDLNGEALVNRIREQRPDMPVIICTGYNPTGLSVHGPVPEVLNKPVDPILMAQRIRAILDHAGATD